LKHLHGADVLDRARVFRGVIAAASLKRFEHVQQLEHADRFSAA